MNHLSFLGRQVPVDGVPMPNEPRERAADAEAAAALDRLTTLPRMALANLVSSPHFRLGHEGPWKAKGGLLFTSHCGRVLAAAGLAEITANIAGGWRMAITEFGRRVAAEHRRR